MAGRGGAARGFIRRLPVGRLLIENVETAARDERHHVPAAEAQGGVRRGHLIGQPVGFVAVRIDRELAIGTVLERKMGP